MAGYVPADSLIYLEANSLPDIIAAIDSLDAWQRLAPAAGLNSVNLGQVKTFSRLAAWTGIGSAETVVLARAQVAVTVIGVEASEAEGSVKIKPRAALVAETHTSERRVRAAIESLVGNFARRAMNNPRVERRETEEAAWTIWSAPEGERRIIAAVADSVAIVGNDEAAVEACLAARRGERQTLAGNSELIEMRERVEADSALAFGHISAASATRLFELAATVYAGQLSSNPRVQSAAATFLPQLAARVLGGAGWSARADAGEIEDRYFFALQNNLSSRLEASLEASDDRVTGVGELLPHDTYQITRYNYRDSEMAWRGLNTAISSQLDALSAPFVSRFLDSALQPYGIENPRAFLRAAGSELATARIDNMGESTVMIARVRDEQALRAEVRSFLGAGARRVSLGDAEMLASTDREKGAAAFVAGYLVMSGTEEALRRCLAARVESRTLAANGTFQRATSGESPTDRASVVTFTDDRFAARAFIRSVSSIINKSDRTNDEDFMRVLAERGYSVSASRLTAGGFQKRTRSSFGQFGALVAVLQPDVEE